MRCCCNGRFDGMIGISAALAACMIGAATHRDPSAAAPKSEPAKQTTTSTDAKKVSPHVLEFIMNRIDGKEQDLHEFEGKVVLIVNVASKCGYTPQYEGLQRLYSDKKDAGLVILGFPANDFGGQEPASNKDIASFCSSKFNVTFPMFEKITVIGDKAHPLYKRLAEQPAPVGGEPKWNFTKFLVDRHGNVVAKFDSKVKPDSPELTKKIDELLAAKAN